MSGDAQAGPLRIETATSMPFDQNAYILWREGDTRAAVVDPGMQPEKILSVLATHSLEPEMILLTHGHVDHIVGVGAIKERWPECPVVIGEGDAVKLTDPERNLSAGYGIPFTSPPADRTVREGQTIDVAGVRLEVRETPGHSAGHVVFVTEDRGQTHVLGGDMLFAGSVGRSDFPDGDWEALRDAIHQKMFDLPDDAIVYPGHGPTTTIGEEKAHNPFVGRAAGCDV